MPYRVNTKRRQKGYGRRKKAKNNLRGLHIPQLTPFKFKRKKKRGLRPKKRGVLGKVKRGLKKTKSIWDPIARKAKDKLADKAGLSGAGRSALDAAYDVAIDTALN